MPAPAVIPAPKAYINAAAVKGFVVECGVLGSWYCFGSTLSLLCHRRVSHLAEACLHWRANAVTEWHITRRRTQGSPVVITVNKTACSRQSLATV